MGDIFFFFGEDVVSVGLNPTKAFDSTVFHQHGLSFGSVSKHDAPVAIIRTSVLAVVCELETHYCLCCLNISHGEFSCEQGRRCGLWTFHDYVVTESVSDCWNGNDRC